MNSRLKVLFLGGTGTISTACALEALRNGIELTLVNRGQSTTRAVPEGAEVLHGDARDPQSLQAALGDRYFDAVVDFIAFTPEQVQTDIDFFSGRVGQFVFISSASAYQKPVARLPIVESTPLRNDFWQYSRDKIACEDLLVAAYRNAGFPATIIRPSHTYDDASIPLLGRHSDIDRMRAGLPVLVQGDGTSLWTLTHSDDFAVAFTGLLGDPRAIGDSFHITSDEALPWNQIYQSIATAAGVAQAKLVHLSSEMIAKVIPELGPGLLGDKAHSVIFDNSKVKSVVPQYRATVSFAEGARRMVSWYDAHPDQARRDPELDASYDRLIQLAEGS